MLLTKQVVPVTSKQHLKTLYKYYFAGYGLQQKDEEVIVTILYYAATGTYEITRINLNELLG